MAAICRNPFDGSSSYGAHVKEEIDVQLFIGSLALFQDAPPLIPILQKESEISETCKTQEMNREKDNESNALLN